MSDQWNFYPASIDDRIASVFVDLGAEEDAPRDDRTDLVWLSLRMAEPREDGLSSQDEYDRLVEIEEALESSVQSAGSIEYVGRVTTAGRRDFFFYAEEGALAERALSEAMVPFSTYEFELGSREDPDWSFYHELLFPSDREMQSIQNRQTVEMLEEQGDVLIAPREVTHWAYFEEASGRDQFAEAVTALGFQEVERRDDADGPRPFALSILREDTVDLESIDELSVGLFDLAREFGGEYDGWETPVVKEEDGDGEPEDDD
jgi:uncharacterized protein (TIGR01619 family)